MKKFTKREILIALIFFFIGITSMYIYNWKWNADNKTLTEELVVNFHENYEIQENLKRNYSEAYIILSNILTECIAKKSECNSEDISKELERIESERDDLNLKLDNSNRQIGNILSKYSQNKN